MAGRIEEEKMDDGGREDLVAAITAMNYGALKQVGKELAEMIEDKEARPKLETAEEFADLLFDWAKAYAPQQTSGGGGG